jgi:arylsulfatase A-like enzyme
MDWVATFLDAAGVAPHPDYPLDGASLLGVLTRPEAPFERELYWRMKFRAQKAMREAHWKYLATDEGEFLFDLSRDPRERANLAKREAPRLAAMRERYAGWEKTIPVLPADAAFAIPYTRADLAHPSS